MLYVNEKPECDRCGEKFNYAPAELSMFRPNLQEEGTLLMSRNYQFTLCRRCARALFAWIGNAQEVKP